VEDQRNPYCSAKALKLKLIIGNVAIKIYGFGGLASLGYLKPPIFSQKIHFPEFLVFPFTFSLTFIMLYGSKGKGVSLFA